MTLGTGVFLAGLIFSIVYLYSRTGTKLNWAKGFKRIGVTFLVLGVIGCLVALGAYYREHHPSRQTEYSDVALGMTMTEVKYAKGQPDAVLGDEAPDKMGFYVLETKNLKDKLDDHLTWIYGNQASYAMQSITVVFNKDKKVIEVSCYSKSSFECPELVGMYDGKSETDVTDKLGKPRWTSISDDSGVEEIYYPDLNVAFYLKQQKVYMMKVLSSAKADQ